MTPFFLAAAVRPSTSPGPPPTDSTVSPPQNLNLPSTLKAWRPKIGAKRMPLARIHSMVSRLRVTSSLAQLGVGAVLGDAAHVVEELLLGVGAEIGVLDLLVGQVGHQPPEVLDAVVDAAEGAGGEAAVAAGFGLRRPLEHEHRDLALGRGERRAEGGVAGADHHDIAGCRQLAGHVPYCLALTVPVLAAGSQDEPCGARRCPQSRRRQRAISGRCGLAVGVYPGAPSHTARRAASTLLCR